MLGDNIKEDGQPQIAPTKFEYLDHTADVQLHAWGGTLEEAIEQLVVSMYGYMTTDLESVYCVYSMDFQANGRDLPNLMFNLLETCLYGFCAEPFFIGRVAKVLSLDRTKGEQDDEEINLTLRVWGESFDTKKHPPGTEIKAVTYSNLQVNERRDEAGKEQVDIYMIVDI